MASTRIVLWLAFALFGFVAADKQCYYPDGTLSNASTQPCNTTAEVSACCDPRDSCTTTGLCLGASGWTYRSSCTDKTWNSPACPSQCHIDPILQTPYSSFAAIYPCVAGLFPTTFCCGSYSNRNCCASNFTLGNTGMAFKPGTDAVEAQVSSLSAALASATAVASAASLAASTQATASTTAVASSSSINNNGMVIGAGVGISLGMLSFGLLGFLVWRERRRAAPGPATIAGGQNFAGPNSRCVTGSAVSGSCTGSPLSGCCSRSPLSGSTASCPASGHIVTSPISGHNATSPVSYGVGTSEWGGVVAPSTQFVTVQQPMRVQVPVRAQQGVMQQHVPLTREDQPWRGPRARAHALPLLPAETEDEKSGAEVRHELQS